MVPHTAEVPSKPPAHLSPTITTGAQTSMDWDTMTSICLLSMAVAPITLGMVPSMGHTTMVHLSMALMGRGQTADPMTVRASMMECPGALLSMDRLIVMLIIPSAFPLSMHMGAMGLMTDVALSSMKQSTGTLHMMGPAGMNMNTHLEVTLTMADVATLIMDQADSLSPTTDFTSTCACLVLQVTLPLRCSAFLFLLHAV